MYACIQSGLAVMRMRTPLTMPAPRREPSYRNALPSRLVCNQLNPLQFEALLGDLPVSAAGDAKRQGAAMLRRVLGLFVPLMVQKFPRTGQ